MLRKSSRRPRTLVTNSRLLRFVHTSDVHLGAYSSSPRGREEPRGRRLEAGFEAVVDLAVDTSADLLLIAGDFFDHARITPDVVAFAVEQINRFPGTTVILPGNHDPIGPLGPYERHSLQEKAPRLMLIQEPTGEFVDFPELDLAIWGRAITVDVTEQPLASPPPRLKERTWNIAIGHGHSVDEEAELERSLRITPTHLAESAQWDYVALGHWDVHTDVSTAGALVVYSGSPASLGDIGYGVAVVVEMGASGVHWHPHTLMLSGTNP
ncbi:MAG TPA: hypothetical protein DGL25_03470 [Dehalococcoidia bacterium]|nr:hypothetical protein [Dehalococcoidia bacterium]